MYEELKNLYRDTVKEQTLKVYAKNMNHIAKLRPWCKTIKEMLENPNQLTVELGKVFNKGLKNNIIATCSSIAKKIMDPETVCIYMNLMKVGNEEQNLINRNNQIRCQDRWARWSEIEEMFFKIPMKGRENVLDKLVIGLYTRLDGFVLRSEFCTMKYIDAHNMWIHDIFEHNYIYYDSEAFKYVIILNTYKTQKKYGRVQIIVEDKKLESLLSYWFLVYNKEEKYLICYQNGKPYKQTNFSRKIYAISQKYLGKNCGVRQFREIKESDTIYNKKDEYHKMDLNEKLKAHHKLLHSFQMAHQYCKK